eukprot:s1407_g10.t1
MVLQFEEVKMVRDGLEVQHGLGGLGHRHSFEYELVRETLMEVLPVYRGEGTKIDAMLEVIQFFTVLGCLTFSASMKGDLDELHTWVEAEDIVPRHYYTPVDPQIDFEIEARNKFIPKLDHYQHVVEGAIKNLDGLLAEITTSATYICAQLRLMKYLLRDLDLLLKEFRAEKGNEQSSPSMHEISA